MKNKNIVFIVIVFLLLSISCSKKDTNSPQLNNLKSDAENPFNFIGETHNACLDYIADDPSFPDLTNEDFYNLCNDILTMKIHLV